MASSRSGFVDHVIDLMRAWAPVRARGMFGGWGLYRAGRMFALIADDVLYLKTDEHSHAAFTDAGCTPFEYVTAARTVRMSYWRAPEACLESPAEMAAWCARAWEAALRAGGPAGRKVSPQRRRNARTKS